MQYDQLSNYWVSTIAERQEDRPRLVGNTQADVVIIGAGFTGLWTAYYLKTLSPTLDVKVIEAERVGHGASGRNGGWVIGSLAGLERHVSSLPMAQRQECCQILADNVDEIGRVLAHEGISADFNKGGAIYAAARYPGQIAIQRDYLRHLHTLGYDEESCYWLNSEQLAEKASFRNGYGGIYHRDVATLNPARLLTGLAQAVEQAGVTILERSRVNTIERHRVDTPEGSVQAAMIVCATEGYTEGLHSLKRHIIPVQSLVVATAPLSEATWKEIGMTERPAFADASRLVNYGHRTADGRFVFGARGAYAFGAKSKHTLGISQADIQMRRKLLEDLFPAFRDVEISYGWGGSLGLSRNFRPHAIVDRQRGIATAGGYAGEGVAASHLFGRTLAELILKRESALTHMPWVFASAAQQPLKRWEPEPLRWLAAQTISLSYVAEDVLMQKRRSVPFLKPTLTKINDLFASIIE
ncbi:NAD(P)/FAD-dependent oxidoreductase [Vreelandella subglaciescola]|uniref:Glycine/D-amino acid oxidase n=1 Tax=Vreelandella subglaciescola TaxID=29571 RepID=A0A1M7FRV1_9GAMM|nr:FAD-binding oxidoreductase [Halomonas subglaciescola]SHM06407.1 Glycine/D-amino acid oxidase [Halomonas subglaciescola]